MPDASKYYVPGVAGQNARLKAYGTLTPTMGQIRPQAGQQAGVTAPAQPAAGAGIYTPQMTRQATNQGVAAAQAASSRYEAAKRFRTPGLSTGLGQSRNMLPIITAGYAGAADRRATIPFNDMGANAKYQLGTEVAQDNEGLGWGNLQQGNSAQELARSNQRQQMGLQLLNQIMGF